MSDLIVTWPKSRELGSYLGELNRARADGLLINYRIRSEPAMHRLGPPGDRRLYRVHNGWIRGYTPLVDITFHGDDVVARVQSDPIPGSWPAGWYLVCRPRLIHCRPRGMEGFRGYRYFERSLVELRW